MRTTAGLGSMSGITKDGSGNSKGHFIFVLPSFKIFQEIRPDLIGDRTALNQLKRSYFTCRMTFQYYMSINAMKKDLTYISINVGSNDFYDRTVWRMTGRVVNEWFNASAAIGDQV